MCRITFSTVAKWITAAVVTVLAVSAVGVSSANAQAPERNQRGQVAQIVMQATFEAIEKATKLDQRGLLRELAAGKSLAEIIISKGGTVEAVKAEVKQTVNTEVQSLVKDGTITEAQSKLILGLMEPTLDALLNRKGDNNAVARRDDATTYLLLLGQTSDATKVSQRQILSDLRDGKTLAQIAKEKNVEIDPIVEKVNKVITDQINALVKNGRIKQETADKRLATLKVDLTTLMNSPAPYTDALFLRGGRVAPAATPTPKK